MDGPILMMPAYHAYTHAWPSHVSARMLNMAAAKAGGLEDFFSAQMGQQRLAIMLAKSLFQKVTHLPGWVGSMLIEDRLKFSFLA